MRCVEVNYAVIVSLVGSYARCRAEIHNLGVNIVVINGQQRLNKVILIEILAS